MAAPVTVEAVTIITAATTTCGCDISCDGSTARTTRSVCKSPSQSSTTADNKVT